MGGDKKNWLLIKMKDKIKALWFYWDFVYNN